MKLTNKQRDYLISRLTGRHYAIKVAVTERETTIAVVLQHANRVKLITEGKVPLNKKYDSKYTNAYIHNVWDFSKYESPAKLSKKGVKQLAKLDKTVQGIRDTIMLGDSELDALKLLAKLDAGVW